MFSRFLLGTNGTILRSIVSKWAMKFLRKYGLKTIIKCEDFVVYREDDELLIHLSGDIRVKEEDMLAFLDRKMDVDVAE